MPTTFTATSSKKPAFNEKLTQLSTPRYEPLITERTVRRFFGLVFGFAAIGLWMIPSAHEAAEVLLLKSAFTATLCFCSIIALLPRT